MRRNQTTITHQIKCLENELGVTLFDRSSGKMKLTDEGRLFLNKVISVFEIVKEMKNEVREDKLQYKGRITIVSTHAVNRYFLPKFIDNFRKKSPEVFFNIEGGMAGVMLERIYSAEADFGILNIENINSDIIYHELFETVLSLIAPKKGMFPLGNKPTLKEISKVPYISFPDSSIITPIIEEKFAKNDLSLNVVLILNNFQAIKEYVAMGMGVCIMDDKMIFGRDRSKLDVFPLDHIFEKRKYRLIMRRGKYLSPAVKAFVRTIKPGLELV